eukprot:TRINITY_DN11258_c1_g1_i1.p1 TRINITY_DN11258_c1_g1~~TRINITY_DN11258_c1_g1_i1.p1  ORF type:complete len:229 (-),score=40.75 TRINITY_DN11258_c1_g1_i1:58-744(-)
MLLSSNLIYDNACDKTGYFPAFGFVAAANAGLAQSELVEIVNQVNRLLDETEVRPTNLMLRKRVMILSVTGTVLFLALMGLSFTNVFKSFYFAYAPIVPIAMMIIGYCALLLTLGVKLRGLWFVLGGRLVALNENLRPRGIFLDLIEQVPTRNGHRDHYTRLGNNGMPVDQVQTVLCTTKIPVFRLAISYVPHNAPIQSPTQASFNTYAPASGPGYAQAKRGQTQPRW